eukprot:GHUV01024220.1.p2 GENE.GHUV01024220.1~~GHUV01024220.1.p2  ORF type:complete len:135 (+),score=10.79 GHUV01024220.1:24-407(+)
MPAGPHTQFRMQRGSYCVGVLARKSIWALSTSTRVGADAAAVLELSGVPTTRVLLVMGVWTCSPVMAVRFRAQGNLQDDNDSTRQHANGSVFTGPLLRGMLTLTCRIPSDHCARVCCAVATVLSQPA